MPSGRSGKTTTGSLGGSYAAPAAWRSFVMQSYIRIMPELPEVETIRRDLAKNLIKSRIKSVRVLVPSSVYPRPPEFERKLQKGRIVAIERRGKVLIFNFGNFAMLSRLGMTGQLLLAKRGGAGKHDRVEITFANGKILIYRDIRKFGRLEILEKNKLGAFLRSFGPEPLGPRFSIQLLKGILQKYPRGTVKNFLLNQKRISGLGNIYADESCFRARIFPGRLVGSLKDREIG